jgi:beta-1,2-mannobiose phosphorylase / 1,2-beta-oligomannan phosphorylase
MIKWWVHTLVLSFAVAGCRQSSPSAQDETRFPDELVRFKAYQNNPVFTGTGTDTWDRSIRERGYILKESDGYHLWYTGYNDQAADTMLKLGYATSPDAIRWTRHPENPVFDKSWTEDMMVVLHEGVYYMFAEGLHDRAHLLTSRDKTSWVDRGFLNITYTDGKPLTEGPYGTPTVFKNTDGKWYLFYERNDEAIWLATSNNFLNWTNVQDEPVIHKGPEAYDRYGVAVNQVILYKGTYYAYYHATAKEDWSEWSTNVAASNDLLHWTKFSGNPIAKENKSSGILVNDGERLNLYTMHENVCVHFPE